MITIFVPFGLILTNLGAWERRTTNRRCIMIGQGCVEAVRAKAQFQSGDADGSMKSYRKLFDADYRDDAMMGKLIAAMTERGSEAGRQVMAPGDSKRR